MYITQGGFLLYLCTIFLSVIFAACELPADQSYKNLFVVLPHKVPVLEAYACFIPHQPKKAPLDGFQYETKLCFNPKQLRMVVTLMKVQCLRCRTSLQSTPLLVSNVELSSNLASKKMSISGRIIPCQQSNSRTLARLLTLLGSVYFECLHALFLEIGMWQFVCLCVVHDTICFVVQFPSVAIMSKNILNFN